MKIELVSLYEIEYYSKLFDFLDLKEDEYFFDDPLVLFEGDPDMIKFDGFTEYFMFIDIDNIRYVISNTDNSDVWNILEKFASENFKDSFTMPDPNNWNSFYDVDNAIAFRNGKGYVYTIWHF